MPFQWLNMRITEEQERRTREAAILERLPRALQEVHDALVDCVSDYRRDFGAESAELQLLPNKIRVMAREESGGRWQQARQVEVILVPSLPGFHIDHGTGGEMQVIEVGLLPGDKLYYRDSSKDQYVTMEELTRRILDRTLFPRLPE